MTAPTAIPPAAITFADDVLAINLSWDSIHLLTIHGTPSHRPTIGAVRLASLARQTVVPAILHSLAAAMSHDRSSDLPIVGYGIATPSHGKIVLTDRHAQIVTLTTAGNAPSSSERDIAITEALISLIAAGPGIHTPAPIAPPTTRARTHQQGIPVRSPRPGDIAVFAPDWGHAHDPHFRRYVRGGYTGVLRSGTAFACTRAVAASIVAGHQRIRADHGERLRLRGHHGDHLAAALDQTIPTIGWDGDDIVVDRRPVTGDIRDLYRIRPCHDGSYLITPATGIWTAVDRDVCDHIDGRPNGQLPPPPTTSTQPGKGQTAQ